MKAVEVLKAARELISDPRRWTTQTFACDKDGWDCDAWSDVAVRFCAFGAVDRIGMGAESGATAFIVRAAREAWNLGPARVNDEYGHTAVMQMFDRAIELAAAEET